MAVSISSSDFFYLTLFFNSSVVLFNLDNMVCMYNNIFCNAHQFSKQLFSRMKDNMIIFTEQCAYIIGVM